MNRTKLPILLVAISACLAAQEDPSGRVGRLSYVNGPVSLQPAGVTDWVDADVNRPLTTGDQIWVGAGGRAEIHVGSTALRLDSNTAFQFLNLDDQTVQVQLSQGNLTVRSRYLSQDQNLEIDTPSLAFTVFHPGEYRIGADPNSLTTNVTVRGGDGEVTAGGSAFPINAGQRAIVVGGDQPTFNLVAAPGTDGWDQWSRSRDLREDRSPSARYVSREVGGYEDLDDYGVWSNEPGYGQVWVPSHVGADWAPYHDGHWAWVAPWGWTWIDNAPWGYAPSHYGRWASVRGRWGWVPGPMNVTPCYAPALVAWVGGGGAGFSLSFSAGNAPAVAWFPLGPREPYIPATRVSPRYFTRVNNTNTVINNTTINNYYNESRNSNNTITNIKYANQNVRNAVVAVPQNAFASGRPVAQISRAVPPAQMASAHFVAVPAIAPQQASVLGPKAGAAARAPRPPAAVFSRPVIARTAPPPPPVAFARQQTALAQSPGRPLPRAAVQQMRQGAPVPTSPVRVANTAQIQRVQPKVGAGPQQAVRQANPVSGRPVAPVAQPPSAQPRPGPASTPAAGRQNVPSSALVVAQPVAPSQNPQPRQQTAPRPDASRRPNAPPPAVGSRPAEVAPNAPARQNARPSPPAVTRPAVPQQRANPQQPTPPPPPNAAQQPSALPPNTARQPSVPSPNAARQPAPPAPNAARQPSVPPSNAARQPTPPPPNAARQPVAPPPSRPQAPPAKVAPPTPQSRPQVQAPPPARQPPARRAEPAPRPKENPKEKPDKKE